MAITREQVLTAVEKYLPRTVNYVRSAEFGDRDPVPVFDRIQQILFTTLLVDPDAVYYLIFLSSQRLAASINTVITQLELLASEQQLKGITGTDPVRIDDLSQLTAARTSLIRLSTSVAQEGSFGNTNLADFQADIEGFMEDQVVPNVAGGNRTQISAAIRATMEALRTSWADVLVQRELVFTLLDKYVDEDLRTRVSVIIISAIQATLATLESALPNLSTEAQAEAAESILVDLAAAEAAITIVGNAPSPIGTLVAGPAEDGRTLSSYLALQSTGRTQPVLPVLTGEDGQLRLEGPNAGAPFASVNGQTVGPGPTATLTDASVPDFTAEGIEAGMYLTLVDIGTTHSIEAVTATELTISPKTPHLPATLQRYAVTNHAPGRYFESPGSSFWDEGDLKGSNTQVTSGTTGEWVRVNKVVAADGTNVYASGNDGVLRARKVEGASSTQPLTSSTFTTGVADPGFFSNGVTTSDELFIVDPPNNVGNPYSIAALVGENELNIVGTWGANGGGPWYIEEPALTTFLFDTPTGTFLTSGTGLGDIIIFSGTAGGLQDGTFGVTSVVNQTGLTPSTPPLTYETGVTWELITAANDRLYSSSVNFSTAGVVVGDLVDIAGYGTFEVVAVTALYIQLDSPFPGLPVALTGLSFEIYGAPFTTTTTFRQGDVNFESLDISNTVEVLEYTGNAPATVDKQAFLEVDGVTYQVQTRLSTTDVLIQPLVASVGKVQIPGQVLEDLNADFIASGVDPTKHALVMVGGPSAGRTFTILSVVSETEILFTPPASASALGDPEDVYEIQPLVQPPGLLWNVNHGLSRQMLSAGFFNSNDVGSIFVWKRGLPDERRIRIDSYVSDNEVWLAEPIDEDEGVQPVAVIRLVKPGMQLYANSRRYTIVDIKDETTLDLDPKMSNAPGAGLDFIVMTAGTNLFSSRIFDPSGAALIDPINGFDSSLAGATVHLMVDVPVKARYLQAYDPGGDGFAEAFQVNTNLRLGFRNITYQVLLDFDNRSNLFRALEVSPLPAEGDILTIWGQLPAFTVTGATSATPDMELAINPSAPSGLLDQNYVIHTGGSQFYGKWVLYDTLNDAITIDPTTDDLRLRVAEVLIEFGELNVLSIDSGSAGEVVDDGDEDGQAFELFDAGADFSGAKFGDRLKVTYPDSSVETTFVTVVVTDQRVRFSPAVTEGAALSWVLERNSVSSALEEVNRLRLQMQELRDLVASYVIERNTTVDNILDLLEDQRLDRAIDLLLDGRVDDFLNLDATTSSYATRARTAIQQVGSSTVPSAELRGNVAGSDSSSGASVAASAGSPSSANATAVSASSDDPLAEDVDVRVALARALNEISSDEVLRSLVFTTFEEQRNRAIFELCGEVESGFVSDEDPTLPWIAQTGSLRSRVNARYQKALDAVQYMIDNPDEFEDIG
jgi:hypothetical protein